MVFRYIGDIKVKVKKKKNLGGRPPYVPNEKDRAIVKSMAPFINHDEIALEIGISDDTMRKYYRAELDSAKRRAHAAVGQSLLMQAVGGPEQNWREAVPAATIFYAKTRMGWKEKVGLDHSGAVGLIDYSKLTDDQLRTLVAIQDVLGLPPPGGK